MNEIELILQEKPEKFANLLKTHTIAFLERCTNEFVWKIWQEYGDTAIPFEEFKRNHLGNRPSKYRYNGLSIPEPIINEAEKIVFSLGGWRGLGTSDLKTLLVFTIIPTSQRIQIFGSCDPDAEDLYHYLLEQIAKHFPDVPPAAAALQPTGINISNITSAGDVNINLSNVAGRDQTGIYTSSTATSLTYQELLQDGIKFLKSLSYDKAIVKLRKAIELEDAETKAHYYLAVALLKGRSFNSSSLHPKTRNEIEKHLKHSRIDNPNWLPPFVLLAVMEIEYHSLHGTPNKNVVVDEVAKRVKQQGLSPEESQLLSSCSLKERTKQRLSLTF